MFKRITSQSLARCTTMFLFIATLAGSWDAWWHAAVGRDTFWEPPHLLLYVAVILAIIAGVYGWRVGKTNVWKCLAIVLLLIPLSAPFDNLWHVAFGVEDLTSPLVIWSPPHLVLIAALIGSFSMVLPLLRQDHDVYAKRVFGAIIFASILALLGLVVSPFEPIGPWHLLGFWGAGFVAFTLTLILVSATRWISGFGGALIVVAWYSLLFTVGGSDTVAPGVEIPPHDHPPKWLTIFSLLVPAILIEYFKRIPYWLQGGIIGLSWSILIYGFSSPFLELAFRYSTVSAVIAIVASVFGGVLAGLLAQKFLKS